MKEDIKSVKLKTNKLITNLANLHKGQKGEILNINNNLNKIIKKRLLDIGFIKGTIVEIIEIAPFNDPVVISIRGYKLCLRKHELNNIIVEVIN